MKQNALLVALALVVCGFASGCEKAKNPSSPDTPNRRELMPLKVGNSWFFQNKQFQDDSLTQDVTWADTVKLEFNWHGYKWYSFDNLTEFGRRNASDGLHALILWEDTSHYEDWLDYKYPVAVGDTFVGYKNSGVTCVSISDTVNVPAGFFDGCIKYKTFAPGVEYDAYDWLCPGVGWVKEEWNYIKDGARIHYLTVLQDYNVDKRE